MLGVSLNLENRIGFWGIARQAFIEANKIGAAFESAITNVRRLIGF